MDKQTPIIDIKDLKVHYFVKTNMWFKKDVVQAVDGISLSIYPGETYGLVGESGCGKSTLGRAIVKINPITSGEILYNNKPIKSYGVKEYAKNVQMIFQDPYASLDPRMTIGDIIAEPLRLHKIFDSEAKIQERVVELLKIVGLKPDHIRRYPQRFSGGQRQRIGIARTLALEPKFIVCDEPISSLDVSIQAQIINLLEKIQKETNVAYLFIGHDINMVRHISSKIGVMYLGNIVEVGESNSLCENPLHPYTISLLSATPIADPEKAKKLKRIILEGEIPSPINPPSGCKFRLRCPKCLGEICEKEAPVLKVVDDHLVACHLFD